MDEQPDNTKGQDLDRKLLMLDGAGAAIAGFREGLYSSTPLCYLNLGRFELEGVPHLEYHPNYSFGRTIGTAAGVAADVLIGLGALSLFEMMLSYMQ